MKLKANMRFHNAFDGKIYDEGAEFNSKEEDAKYLIQHKIASEVKVKSDNKDKK